MHFHKFFYCCFTTQLNVIFRNCEKFVFDTPRMLKKYRWGIFRKNFLLSVRGILILSTQQKISSKYRH